LIIELLSAIGKPLKSTGRLFMMLVSDNIDIALYSGKSPLLEKKGGF
jgi:hypothetical protein